MTCLDPNKSEVCTTTGCKCEDVRAFVCRSDQPCYLQAQNAVVPQATTASAPIPPATHPPLFGLGGAYLEGEAAVLLDRQLEAIEAAVKRAQGFTGATTRTTAIAVIDTYLRVMREGETT